MLSEKYKGFLSWVVYQIYPRSFKDTNGDGIGDLCGIIEKLDYLCELGVNAIWICPCYKSPNVDNGYDIADYFDIMDDFGTMDDMKNLIKEAHSRGIKVIMDLVPNHTSAEHKWFKESKKSKDNPYSDYYYWFDEPQNDWKTISGGNPWEYCEERGQYYFHHYDKTMPDLNWTNPKVREGVNEVVDFWSGLGVDGFRCDVIHEISKDFKKGIMSMGPYIHEYINGIFGRPESKHLFTVGECWVWNANSFLNLTKEERNELSTMFQFEHIGFGRENKYIKKPQSLTALRDVLLQWQAFTGENDLLYTLFTDNHDQAPFISRAGDVSKYRYEIATCVAAMLYTLRGIPFIYQGQEFGTLSPHSETLDDFRDYESFNYYELHKAELGEEEVLKRLNFGSRDNARHPIAWDSSKYCGFSEVEPWISPNTHYKTVNLEADRNSDKSVFNFYKSLLKIRKENNAIILGSVKALNGKDEKYSIVEREYEDEKIVICCNFEEESKIEIPYSNLELLLSNSLSRKDNSSDYKPYEIAIYKVI